MRNLILFSLLALTIIFSSCNNQKHLVKSVTHETTDSVINLNVVSTTNTTDLIQSEINVITNEIKTDFSEKTTTVIEYSEPDSLGKQSVIRTITQLTKNNIKIDKTIEAQIVDSTKKEVNNSYIDKSNIDFHNKIKTKTTTKEKSKTPIKVLWITIIAVILIMIFLKWKKIFPFD